MQQPPPPPPPPPVCLPFSLSDIIYITCLHTVSNQKLEVAKAGDEANAAVR